MGKGTRFPEGVLDGLFTVEGGSALLVAGVTNITLGLDSVKAAVAASMGTDVAPIKVTWSGQVLTLTMDGGLTSKVSYIAVGPRTTQYA